MRRAAARGATGALFGLLVAGFAAVALCLGPALSAGAAGSGYSPTSPPPASPPPPDICAGGTQVPAGGGTVSGTADGSTIVVTVPAGDFADGVEVSIVDTSSTAPVPVGDYLVLAFGVNFCVGGSKVTGTFPVPVSVTVTNPAIAAGQRLFIQTASGLVPVTPTSIAAGSFTVSITGDPDFVLVAAPITTAAVIPGATTVVTGKPFLLEGILAASAFVLGLIVLVIAKLRPRHS